MGEEERLSEADVASAVAAMRLHGMCVRAGMSHEQADGMISGLRSMVALFALVLARNEDRAPNHITIELEADDGRWEVTIRRHDGMTPATRIAALEAQHAADERTIAELRAEVERLTAHGTRLLFQATDQHVELARLRARDEALRGVVEAAREWHEAAHAWDAPKLRASERKLIDAVDALDATTDAAEIAAAHELHARCGASAEERAADDAEPCPDHGTDDIGDTRSWCVYCQRYLIATGDGDLVSDEAKAAIAEWDAEPRDEPGEEPVCAGCGDTGQVVVPGHPGEPPHEVPCTWPTAVDWSDAAYAALRADRERRGGEPECDPTRVEREARASMALAGDRPAPLRNCCWTWARSNIANHDQGHHVDCPQAPLGLIRRLRDGMRVWASDEDGVHPDAWDAYADACEALGEPRPNPDEPHADRTEARGEEADRGE